MMPHRPLLSFQVATPSANAMGLLLSLNTEWTPLPMGFAAARGFFLILKAESDEEI